MASKTSGRSLVACPRRWRLPAQRQDVTEVGALLQQLYTNLVEDIKIATRFRGRGQRKSFDALQRIVVAAGKDVLIQRLVSGEDVEKHWALRGLLCLRPAPEAVLRWRAAD